MLFPRRGSRRSGSGSSNSEGHSVDGTVGLFFSSVQLKLFFGLIRVFPFPLLSVIGVNISSLLFATRTRSIDRYRVCEASG